ncbi:DoxX family protein [Nocardiopsis ansamitocini]|uniref:DoxX family protein n=1 Tax=Nocardiopsis ansamitocini TaxID=1670832 RepID=A0A9W6P6P9_9ACTN|nr:DoxX family protein [Nocardiopsis ansamitocini]GLU48037.1 hypothetical protein Nans01_23880 [Nocardiopsis ansamitocini]
MGVTRMALYDAAALAARMGLGAILAAHALLRLPADPTTAAVGPDAGMPLPEVVAQALPYLELSGGVAITVGLLTPIAGISVAIAMGGALLLGASDDALPPAKDLLPIAAEHPYVMTTALLSVLVAVNPGRVTMDRWLFGRRGGPARSEDREGTGGSAKRPDQAPPLPYSEEQVTTRRPSRASTAPRPT